MVCVGGELLSCDYMSTSGDSSRLWSVWEETLFRAIICLSKEASRPWSAWVGLFFRATICLSKEAYVLCEAFATMDILNLDERESRRQPIQQSM